MIIVPEDWEPLAGAEGAATVGVWRARVGGERWIVKRLARPAEEGDRRSFRWWRRELEFARSDLAGRLAGLRAPRYRVEEDDAGATLWSAEISSRPVPDKIAAHALGRLTTTRIEDPGWFPVGRLRDRVGLAAAAGGVELLDPDHGDRDALTLARRVWDRRAAVLDRLDSLPQVLCHGDALPRNLLRHDGSTVTAIDWDQLGYGPIGADLASFGLWAGSPAESLLPAFTAGAGSVHRHAVVDGLACTTSLIGVTRAIRAAGVEQADGAGPVGPYRARLDRSVWSMIRTLAVVP
ncbi:aminoglycoside phosphotransferase family protein [Microlunatus speluncae]|uniref:aminoglycoside phosphotransferase family protein n=1 Tax=Microlunatus speluncae TaxID=2594267 RepID=UPI00137644DC|nr:aminoglycoside phosphotransferase family protein [Microlunatus speluncae]